MSERAMNRPTTNLTVCSRAILRCTRRNPQKYPSNPQKYPIKNTPNAKCIIARYYRFIFLNFMKPHLPQLRKGAAIRQANSSCCGDFFRLLRSRVPPPVDGARREQVGSLHFPKPTHVQKRLPARPLKFGASYREHCHQ